MLRVWTGMRLSHACRHIGEEKGLQEAIDIYKQLQQIIEDIHGIRNDQSAFALRSIADVHLMLKENGVPSTPALQSSSSLVYSELAIGCILLVMHVWYVCAALPLSPCNHIQ